MVRSSQGAISASAPFHRAKLRSSKSRFRHRVLTCVQILILCGLRQGMPRPGASFYSRWLFVPPLAGKAHVLPDEIALPNGAEARKVGVLHTAGRVWGMQSRGSLANPPGAGWMTVGHMRYCAHWAPICACLIRGPRRPANGPSLQIDC